MMVVVCYDVATLELAGRRRLRRIAKECKNFGQRVQKSVFECVVDPSEWADLRGRLLKIYEPNEDSLRFYFMGSNWKGHVDHFGVREPIDLDEPLII